MKPPKKTGGTGRGVGETGEGMVRTDKRVRDQDSVLRIAREGTCL